MARFSLRQLLAFVAACAVALVSLKYASQVWLTVTLGIALIALFIAIIVAAVDRGPRQAFAIGFTLIVIAYGWAVFNVPQVPSGGIDGSLRTGEFGLWTGHLPTTQLLRHVYTAVQGRTWFDSSTGKELVNFDPANPSIPVGPGGGFGGYMGGGGGGFGGGGIATAPATPMAFYRESPTQEDFAPIGHLWWAILLGYLGGRFGQVVYARRANQTGK
jgi:hypothetical protein